MENNSNPTTDSKWLLIVWVIISLLCLIFSIVSLAYSLIQKKELDKVKIFVNYQDPDTQPTLPSS